MGKLCSAIVLTIALVACSGSEDPNASDDSATRLLDRVPTSAPDRPSDFHTDVGALKFSDHVFGLVFFALASGDIKPLMAIADKDECESCLNLGVNIKQRAGRVQVGSEPHRVSEVKVTDHKGDRYTINQQVTFPSGSEIEAKTGKEYRPLEGQEIEMNVYLRWSKGAWVLLDYTVATNK